VFSFARSNWENDGATIEVVT